jgi:hypothetical protein
MVMFPDRKIGVILMWNADYADLLYELPAQIAWIVADLPITEKASSAEYLQLLSGRYESTGSTRKRKVRFDVVGDALVGSDGNYHFKLVYAGDGLFINPSVGDRLVFNSEDPKKITLRMMDTITLKKVN